MYLHKVMTGRDAHGEIDQTKHLKQTLWIYDTVADYAATT